jgi:pSer/pThr/pTyr-binding forkhead associated (FHA) protein
VVPAKPCRHCGRRTTASVELVFPWGVERLPPGQVLAVGREDSPLARNLAQYPNVSRRHAELAAAGGSVTVTDLGSANGTFVNDRRIEPRDGVPARAGDRVRLAADLVILIRAGGGR